MFYLAFKKVFSRPWYILLALVVALLFLLIAIWLPNISSLRHVVGSTSYNLGAKLNIFWSYFGFLGTNFTPLTRILTIVVATLSGVNIAMLVFYLKNRIQLERSAGVGLMGTLAALLGVGCASCGSVLISSFIGLSATAAFTGALPLRGAELGLIGALVLLVSIYLIAKKIQNPLVCKV